MNDDAKRFLRDQIEAVSLARQQWSQDFTGSEGHRLDAWYAVIRHAEQAQEQLSFSEALSRAKMLADWLRGG